MPDRRSNFARLSIEYVPLSLLKPNARNPRKHPQKQIDQITKNIDRYGVIKPIGVDEDGNVIYGNAVVIAADQLGISELPVVRFMHLSPADKRAVAIADNKIAENGSWDLQILAEDLQMLATEEIDFDFSVIGFETAEVDLLLDHQATAKDDILPEISAEVRPVTEVGDVFQLDRCRLICGDARDRAVYRDLVGEQRARAAITDPPYNVRIDGHVGGRGNIKHREFAMAVGEMPPAAFIDFLTAVCSLLAEFTIQGSLHYLFMDWGHSLELLLAARTVYSEHKNTCVWAKTNAGMGSFYRSQHELVHVFKSGTAPHINNVQLGAHGRNRTNLWTYPGVNGFGRERELLALHPTVKPVALVSDIIKDCTQRGDIVLDPFAGSGTTSIAAEKTGRRAVLIEIDPLYCDLIVRRWQVYTGETAFCLKTGHSFAEREARSAELSYRVRRLLPAPSPKRGSSDEW